VKIGSSFALWSIEMFLKLHSLFCLLVVFLYLFGLSLDHPCQLNVTYVYPEEVVFTFLVFALLEDKQQFKHGGV